MSIPRSCSIFCSSSFEGTLYVPTNPFAPFPVSAFVSLSVLYLICLFALFFGDK